MKKGSSKFSITESLAPPKEELKENLPAAEASLPVSHFTETDLAAEWQKFLSDLKKNDIVRFSAINGFRLKKINEETIEVGYPSDSSKVEFDEVSAEFLNHFRHKVNNFKVNFTFKMDVALKKEVVTKRKLFDKLAEINPILNDLNDLMKFDFS